MGHNWIKLVQPPGAFKRYGSPLDSTCTPPPHRERGGRGQPLARRVVDAEAVLALHLLAPLLVAALHAAVP
jgi:hypothetical protein